MTEGQARYREAVHKLFPESKKTMNIRELSQFVGISVRQLYRDIDRDLLQTYGSGTARRVLRDSAIDYMMSLYKDPCA